MTSLLEKRTVPQVYEAIYQALCPSDEDRISGKLFLQLATAASVDRVKAKQIWDASDERKTGVLNRKELYLALAYIGLCQRNEVPSLAALERFDELPPVQVADLGQLRQTARRSSKHMSYTYRELEEAEFIQVSLAKASGLFMKHTNYAIFSKRQNKTVTRRYSDFEPLDAYLRKVYPYRIIPALPPKTFGSGNKSPEFLERRRKALKRYLTFLGRHPALRDDEVLIIFITDDNAADLQAKLKERVKVAKEEYLKNPIAKSAGDLVPDDVVQTLQGFENEIPPLVEAFSALLALTEKLAECTLATSDHWRSFGDKLKDLGGITSGYTAGHDRWRKATTNLKTMANLMATVSDRGDEQRLREEDGMVNNLTSFLEVLEGMKDLLTRRAKGIVKDLTSNSRKLQSDKEKLTTRRSSTSSRASLEAKVNQLDSAAGDLSLQNTFSIYCVWEESKLVKANFALIGTTMEELASSQLTSHKQLCGAWEQIIPVTGKLVEDFEIEDGL